MAGQGRYSLLLNSFPEIRCLTMPLHRLQDLKYGWPLFLRNMSERWKHENLCRGCLFLPKIFRPEVSSSHQEAYYIKLRQHEISPGAFPCPAQCEYRKRALRLRGAI